MRKDSSFYLLSAFSGNGAADSHGYAYISYALRAEMGSVNHLVSDFAVQGYIHGAVVAV